MDFIKKNDYSQVDQGQYQRSGSNQKTNNSSSNTTNPVDTSIYADNMNYSAREALTNLTTSSLFAGQGVDQYFNRMVCAVEDMMNNDQWKINMDADGDGEMEDVNLVDAVADSFDSELDLYIMEEVNKVMKKYGTCSKAYLGQQAIDELRSLGIVVESVGAEEGNTNRVYSFSLVDADGNVLTDANGKKGSYLFADCLIPDGCAQGAEINLSSILDQMGKDCISKADFIGKEGEYEKMLQRVRADLDAGAYSGNGGTDTLYGNRKDILQAVHDLWGGNGPAPGVFGPGYGRGGDGSDSEDSLGGIATAKEKLEENKAINAKKKTELKAELLEKAIEKYKSDNNGEEPTGVKLDIIESDVDLKVNSKYGYN